MSTFGKYGVGGSNPGKYPAVSDDNNGNFDLATATVGTETNQPDSKPAVTVASFGRPEHNNAGTSGDA